MPEDLPIDNPITDYAQWHLAAGQDLVDSGPQQHGPEAATAHHMKAQSHFLASIAVSLYTLTAVQAAREERDAEEATHPMRTASLPPEESPRTDPMQDLVNLWRGQLTPLGYLHSLPGSSSRSKSEGYVSQKMQPEFGAWLVNRVLSSDTLNSPELRRIHAESLHSLIAFSDPAARQRLADALAETTEEMTDEDLAAEGYDPHESV